MTLLEGVGAGAGLLLGHEFAELGLVHLHALFGGHLEGQLNREAVGVVQLEGVLAGHDGLGGIALGLVDGHVENRGAGLKGAAEGVFLAIRGFGHLMEGVVELRVAGLHGGLGGREEGGQHRIGHAEHAHGAHGAAQQAAQHVATAHVGRAHAVGHDHQGGAHVVSDHAEAHVGVLVLAVL